tara:strand:+ start:39 stop:275 length:237 start_codon:yes stop_codon:yes gene_type:complete
LDDEIVDDFLVIRIKKNKKELVSSAVAAVIPVSIKNNYTFTTTFTTPLDFKFFDFLKYVLFQFYHLLFVFQKDALKNP